MKNIIGPFSLYTKKPNAIKHGFLYTMDVILPVPLFKKRTVRVFLPDNYDESLRYPVLYMSDGQNIVDKYTTAFGEWNIDLRMNELQKQGYPGFIVVGIDCPKDEMARTLEYAFPMKQTNRFEKQVGEKIPQSYPDKLLDYIANELKPIIDKWFSTRKEKEYTACGGSSMGGIFALNLMTKYPQIFSFSLSFSPAYHLHYKKDVIKLMNSRIKNLDNKNSVYLYSGMVGFEKDFVRPAKYMKTYLDKHNVRNKMVIDPKGKHCERDWSRHFSDAIKFWFNNIK